VKCEGFARIAHLFQINGRFGLPEGGPGLFAGRGDHPVASAREAAIWPRAMIIVAMMVPKATTSARTPAMPVCQ
jgi:hypothetical protein